MTTLTAPNSTTASRALLLSALAAIFWGTNFEAMRLVLIDLPPWTAAAMRFVPAALVAMLWLALRNGLDLKVLRRNALTYLILGLIGITGFNAALFLGMETSSPVTAALIMGTSPLATNLGDALLGRRRPEAIALIGMGISLVGVALTVGAFSGTRFASGDLLIAAGSLGWAIYSIGCRRLVRGAAPLETAVWTMGFGALALLGIALLREDPVQALAAASAVTWGAGIYMALIGSVLAIVFWQVGITVRGPAATSVLFNLVPVSALVVSAMFGRMPGWSQIVGVMVAIFGVWLAGRARR